MVGSNVHREGVRKYSIEILMDKSDEATVTAVSGAISDAKDFGRRKYGNDFSVTVDKNTPLQDGDLEKTDPIYSNRYYLRANSIYRPEVVDATLQPVTDPRQLYPGCLVRVSLDFYPYRKQNEAGETVDGVAAELGNVQILDGGQRFYPRIRAAQEFGEPRNTGSSSVNP